MFQDGQCPVRGNGGMNFPRFISPVTEQLTDRFEEGHAVIHKKHAEMGGIADRVRFLYRGRFEFAGGGGRIGRRGVGWGDFKIQFHLTQAQGLAGLQGSFGNGLAADERAIGGSQVPDVEFIPAQTDFAMAAGDRSIDYLELISIGAPDRDPARSQFMGRTAQPRTDDHEPGHMRWTFPSVPLRLKELRQGKLVLAIPLSNQITWMNRHGGAALVREKPAERRFIGWHDGAGLVGGIIKLAHCGQEGQRRVWLVSAALPDKNGTTRTNPIKTHFFMMLYHGGSKSNRGTQCSRTS